jgi:hypothetical protein
MRILIISFFNSWVTHFGTELEIAQRHLDDGDEVTMLGCDGAITCCDANPLGVRKTCIDCIDNRYAGLELLSSNIKLYKLGDYLSQNDRKQAERIAAEIDGPENARNLSFQDTDLGWGALSSTVSRFRDPDCKSNESLIQLRKFGVSALRSFLATTKFLDCQKKFDSVYIFNGRFASTRGAYRAAQHNGVPTIYLHERGSSVKKFQLYKNDFPHSRTLLKQEAEKLWNQEELEAVKLSKAKEFYENRRFGKPTSWKPFTELQQAGSLPESWNPEKKNIAIFNSSEDEFAAIGKEWLHLIYPKQSTGISRIVKDLCSSNPDVHIYLRIHPNLMKVKNSDLSFLLELKHPQLTTILPDSPVCSYALLDHSDTVLTFGSTMGAEATFWRKPSVLASHAFYQDFDVAYRPQSHQEVLDLLKSDLLPKPIVGAVKYGYYMNCFGMEYKYWNAKTFLSGEFKNERITPEFANPLLKMLLRATYGKPFSRKLVSMLGNRLRELKRILKSETSARS